MDEVGLLIKALVKERPYDLLQNNRKYLEFANSVFELSETEDYSTKALEAVLEYVRVIEEVPSSIDSVIHFVRTNRTHNTNFEKSELYDSQLVAIKDDENDDPIPDASILIEGLYRKAYDSRLAFIYKTGANIALGAATNPHTKEKGPIAADEYIKQERENLVERELVQVSGELVENLDYIQEYVNGFMIGDAKRVYTGIRSIDEVTLIGRKQRNKWIGILGYTHHGKSLLLNTIIYNMASNGANIMLVPRESSVEEAWMNFVWLHHSKVCPERPIVSMAEWMRSGSAVGMDVYNTIQFIIKDLREGNTLPGKIFVYSGKSWDDVANRACELNKKYNFDVLAIDYFAHLDTDGGNKKDSDIDKFKKALRKAQMMSLDGIDGDKSGLVIMTPLQANRKGYEEAAKKEGADYGRYESLNAVEFFAQAAQDMDCIMSVWFEGDSCKEVEPKQMIVHCMKGRGNMQFPSTRLEVNPFTGLLTDIDGSRTTVVVDSNANDLSVQDTQDVLYTKTTLNTDDWGI